MATGASPRRKRPAGLVPADFLEERLEELERKIHEDAQWLGPEDRATKRTLWVVEEVRFAIRQAGELYVPTARAARLSGWDAETLQRWARAALTQGELPAAWRGLQVRRTPHGYEFKASALPRKPAG